MCHLMTPSSALRAPSPASGRREKTIRKNMLKNNLSNPWRRKTIFALAGLCCYITSSIASELYFLCGPDEDGCFDDQYGYCACVPQDQTPNEPHCLDFNAFKCTSLSDTPHCAPRFIYKNQGDCLATIFHSTPKTPCRVKTLEFCIEHQIQFCEKNVDPHHCHALPE